MQQEPCGQELAFDARCRANEAQFQQFARGLAAVMNQWTALHLVTRHIDASAFQNLYQALLDWHLKKGEVYKDEMELFFDDFFLSARSVIVEDDSLMEVSELLHRMYCRCCRDDFSTVEHFISTEAQYRQENPLAQCVNGGDIEQDEDEEQLGNPTTAEAALANSSDGFAPEAENGGNEEAEAPPPPPPPQQLQQQQPKQYRRKKNAVQKGKDGWSYVV